MKKLLVALLALVSLAVVAAGCGGGDKKADNGADKKVTLKVGATAVPHAEILNQIKGTLAKEGVDLQIIEFSDYVKPNLALNDKELDANFFQHEPYLDTFVSERKMNLVSAGKVHIEPMGIYSKKIKSLNDIPEGAKIAIPNDPSNGGRALALLQSAKLLKLKDGVGVKATVGDIVGNDKKLKIVEIEAALLAGVEREAMTLRLTLRDASNIRRDGEIPVQDLSFTGGEMRLLQVKVVAGGVDVSKLDLG